MSFLYPLFLIAGFSLAIPVLIHLFNLRRYKTVFFPHTRFLQSIQLKSQKQSKLRYKWLLALRLLFLALLVLAFAQPFFSSGTQKNQSNKLQVIYIDNSASMSVKKGARSLLDVAKDAARRQVQQSIPGTRYILLTNDKPVSYQPLPADKVLAEISSLDLSAASHNSAQVLAQVQGIVQSEVANGADLYYYSDFQRNAFTTLQDKSLMKGISFYGVPVQPDAARNIYIDTAYLDAPVLQTGQQNKLIVHTRAIGKLPDELPVLQLSVNGQVKTAGSLAFNDKNESIDTLSFQVGDASWQNLTLSINDASVRFDDTFHIATRTTPSLSVLVVNQGQPNPYIQAAFRAYNGFRLNQVDAAQVPADLKEYNLVILNGITRMEGSLPGILSNALQQGQGICIFPGRTNDVSSINSGLQQLADIRFEGIDTAVQTASAIQQGSALVKDMFEHIPENVQLPVANWHYIIRAGLSANQQAVLSFRNGDPFLARYTPAKGSLYIAATAADLQSGNFPGSYFFAPFLYQMALQSRGGDIYALTAGRQQPAYLPLGTADERNMIHLYGPGIDAIPPQRPNGAGLDVFADQVVQQAGFYSLAGAGTDTINIALNQDRTESQLDIWDAKALREQWKGNDYKWLTAAEAGNVNSAASWAGFPLWKICAILAVLMLAAETYLLAGGFRKQKLATQ